MQPIRGAAGNLAMANREVFANLRADAFAIKIRHRDLFDRALIGLIEVDGAASAAVDPIVIRPIAIDQKRGDAYRCTSTP